MRSKASIGGHPLHTVMVTIPIGMFTAALASDIAYQVSGQIFWYEVAWWALLAGMVSALAAAVPGLIDYFAVARHTPARATAIAHLIINVTVVAVYTLSLWLRRDYGALEGTAWALAFGLEAVSFAALGASGWLGGEMVYRFGLGMNRDAMRISMFQEDSQGVLHEDSERTLR